MSTKIFSRGVLLLLACVSLYFYARFTVDDAFISWRYGANLVKHGVWDYNPSHLDPTQAYTNPIYAALSIVPSHFGWDVVLFFKLVSVGIMLAFVAWFAWLKQASWGMVLFFLAFPATVIHLFGGLETFLYVFLMGALCIALYENKVVQAVVLSVLLMFTRPEAWLLAALVPACFLVTRPDEASGVTRGLFWRPDGVAIRRALGVAAALCGVLLAYFAFHLHQYGDALPNTFRVKHVGGFSFLDFLVFLFYCFPVALLLPALPGRLVAFLVLFFGAVSFNYAGSTLAMNYAGRFAYHLFAPLYLFGIYMAARQTDALDISVRKGGGAAFSFSLPYARLINGSLVAGVLVFGAFHDVGSLQFMTYYPRALSNHAEMGKLIRDVSAKYGLHALAIGDAGMAAYHANVNVLDINGLGSTLVAKHGLTAGVLDTYQVDLIAFYANPSERSVVAGKQDELFRWAREHDFVEICDVYWRKEYVFKMYARRQLPMPELTALCERSRTLNNISDGAMRATAINVPPWRYWHE